MVVIHVVAIKSYLPHELRPVAAQSMSGGGDGDRIDDDAVVLQAPASVRQAKRLLGGHPAIPWLVVAFSNVVASWFLARGVVEPTRLY